MLIEARPSIQACPTVALFPDCPSTLGVVGVVGANILPVVVAANTAVAFS